MLLLLFLIKGEREGEEDVFLGLGEEVIKEERGFREGLRKQEFEGEERDSQEEDKCGRFTGGEEQSSEELEVEFSSF